MKLGWANNLGCGEIPGPTGRTYSFKADPDHPGLRTAEIEDEQDQAWFLDQKDSFGRDVFVSLEESDDEETVETEEAPKPRRKRKPKAEEVAE